MVGIQDAVAPQMAAAPEVMPETIPDGGEMASPEEQELYNHFVAKSQMLIYSDKVTDDFLAEMAQAKDPIVTLGNFAGLIAFRVVSSAKEAGSELQGEIVLSGGAEIVEALTELAEEAKAATLDESQMEGALFAAVDKYRELLGSVGGVDQAEAASDMQLFSEAERSGRLEQMIAGSKSMGAV